MNLINNNKGLTLIEIIISIALISVILLFLFRILILLRYDDNYEAQNSKMIINKSQIIQNIENDFIEKGLQKVTCNEGESKTIFTFNDSTSKTLTLNGKNLLYGIENQEIGRALDEDYVYGGIIISKKTIGINNYLSFDISVNYEKSENSADSYRIKLMYIYKNNDVNLENCQIIQE